MTSRFLKKMFVIIIFLCPGIVYSQVTQEWVKNYAGPSWQDDFGRATTIDSDGYSYVTGQSKGNISDDIVTIKYDTDGKTIWTTRYEAPGGFNSVPSAITVDSAGFIYVTGYVETAATGNMILTGPSSGKFNIMAHQTRVMKQNILQ